jgi:hypothetical protein
MTMMYTVFREIYCLIEDCFISEEITASSLFTILKLL